MMDCRGRNGSIENAQLRPRGSRPRSLGSISSSIRLLVFQTGQIFNPMITLFLPTGNRDVEKTVTLTNRYTNTYFCT
jgi:hypothetical protein